LAARAVLPDKYITVAYICQLLVTIHSYAVHSN